MKKTISKEVANRYVGMSEVDATQQIKADGFRSRVLRRDGQVFAGTCDMCTDRINLDIDEGHVIAVSIG